MTISELLKAAQHDVSGEARDSRGEWTSGSSGGAPKVEAPKHLAWMERVKHALEKYPNAGPSQHTLATIAVMMPPGPGNDYQEMLDRGKSWKVGMPYPKKYASLQGKAGDCFMNAYLLAHSHPELTYVEGYATHIIPTHHAWCVDHDGNVIDPTWDGPAFKDSETRASDYYGVPFPDLTEVGKKMVKWGTYGYYLKGPMPNPRSHHKGKQRELAAALGVEMDKRLTASDLVKLITYDKQTGIRRLRDEGGKFTGRASEAGVPDSILNSEPGTKNAVFTMGGPGAGKTGLVSMYVGTPPGKPMKRFGGGPNVATRPKVVRELELKPLEGFSQENVVDCDRHKKMLKGLYSDHVLGDGTRGPSGPTTKDEFDKLPQESQLAALEAARGLGYPSIEAFAMTLPENAGKPPEEASRSYAGGLTHELSTESAERQYRKMLDGDKSFVYDAVGNPTRYERMVREALDKGFHVILHHADSDLENNQENNYWRDRTVDPKIVMSGYSKSQKAAHHLENVARDLKGQGYPIEFLRTKTNTEKQRQGAAARGWSPTGPMPGTQAAALPPWDQKHKLAEAAKT